MAESSAWWAHLHAEGYEHARALKLVSAHRRQRLKGLPAEHAQKILLAR